MMRLAALITALLLTIISCSRKTSASEFSAFANDFVYKTLAFSPVTAPRPGTAQVQRPGFRPATATISAPRSIQAAAPVLRRSAQTPAKSSIKRSSCRPKTAPITTSSTRRSAWRCSISISRSPGGTARRRMSNCSGQRAVQPLCARIRAESRAVRAHHRAYSRRFPHFIDVAQRQLIAGASDLDGSRRKKRMTATSI